MTTPPDWRLVSATRMREYDFWRHSYLGRSLLAMAPELRPRELAIRFENTGESALGLSTVFNRAIESASPSTIVLSVHDDVYLHDLFLYERLKEGLRTANVIGLAGSLDSDLSQPSWGLGFEGDDFRPVGWQRGPGLVLSGAVSHSAEPLGAGPPALALSHYGPVPHEVHLLDGLFLAFRAGDVQSAEVRFDEELSWHLYDLDFCRQATRAGLRLSTAATLVTHASGGNFGTASWKAAARRYLQKWARR